MWTLQVHYVIVGFLHLNSILLELNTESEGCSSSDESGDSNESAKEEELISKRSKVEEEPKPIPFSGSFGSKVIFTLIWFLFRFLGYIRISC